MAFMAIEPVMQAIYTHPFTVELVDGTLPLEKFIYYMQQDSLYLVDYARALTLTAAKMELEKDISLGLRFAQEGLLAERELHKRYFKEFRVPPTDSKGPACTGYCAHLLARAALGSVGEGMAALLPCFWIYREVGNHVRRLSDLDNPYFRWIESYSSEQYSALVDMAMELTDGLADDAGDEESRRMFDGFLISSRYEYCFWDDAYEQREWPL
jgi:thiaminase/transcriptional activator TenA